MEYFPTEKNMSAIDEDPIGGLPGEKYVHDPMGIDPFKGLSQIREKDGVVFRLIIHETLYLEVISLRFPKEIKQSLGRVERTNEAKPEGQISGSVDDAV